MPEQKTEPTRWEILARERNARVVLCHTPDAYVLTELTRSADRALRALRDRAFTSLSVEQATPLFQEYNETILSLHSVLKKICDLVQIKYRPPRTIAKMLQYNEDDEDDEEGIEPIQETGAN